MFDLLRVLRASWNASSKWIKLHVRAWGDESTGVEFDEDVFLLHPFGLAVLPKITSTLRAWGWQDGHEHFVPWLRDTAHSLASLLEGETRVYSVGRIAVAISLRQDGSVRVNSDGSDIVLNNGTLRVARDTDAVNASAALTTWFAAVQAATGVAPPVGAVGAISGGASSVKA